MHKIKLIDFSLTIIVLLVKSGIISYTLGSGFSIIFSSLMAIARLYPLKLYLRYLPNIVFLVLAVGLNLAMWFWLFWNIAPTSELISLHYTVLFGVDLIGAWYQIFFIPFFGLVICTLNFVIGWFFFPKDRFVTNVLNTTATLSQVFLFISISLLIFINS